MRWSLHSLMVLRRVAKTSSVAGVLWLIFAVSVVQAQPSWRVVKKYVQPDVEIVRETREALVLRHPDWPDTMLVLTTEQREDSDIYEVIARRRGGNPYRTWKATEAFWNDPKRPKQTWGRYFRAEFLRLIRPPHSGKPQRDDSLNAQAVFPADSAARYLVTIDGQFIERHGKVASAPVR